MCRGLTGALWASCSMLISAYIPNKYVVIVSPFIIKFALIRFYIGIQMPDNLRLDYWLCGRTNIINDNITLLIITITVLSIIGVSAIAFTRKVRKKVEND